MNEEEKKAAMTIVAQLAATIESGRLAAGEESYTWASVNIAVEICQEAARRFGGTFEVVA